MTLQVLLLGTIVTRTLSLESSNSSQSVTAKEAADTGIERLHQSLISYSGAGTLTSTTALSVFGSGQAQAISNASISVTNPETGLSASTPVTISAYVGQARGDLYELISTATYRDAVITSRKWVQLGICASALNLPTVITTASYNSCAWNATQEGIIVDSQNHRAFASGTHDNTTNPTRLSTIAGNTKLPSSDFGGIWNSFVDTSSGNFYWTDSYNLFYVKPDNTLVTTSFAMSDLFPIAVNPVNGDVYLYASNGSAATWGTVQVHTLLKHLQQVDDAQPQQWQQLSDLSQSQYGPPVSIALQQ